MAVLTTPLLPRPSDAAPACHLRHSLTSVGARICFLSLSRSRSLSISRASSSSSILQHERHEARGGSMFLAERTHVFAHIHQTVSGSESRTPLYSLRW